MNEDVLRWLQAQLGPDTDGNDLAARYERLRSAKAVALEVLHERLAALVAEPLKVTVNGIATIDNSANVTALERHLVQLETVAAPDAPSTASSELIAVPLRSRPRR
ncbi:hypothetical protein [Streptomyces sp. NBC_01304]|uniref:hypothetical protein n=1 Tax=Streptomyces sp. NBC_01304 TaxID=2903818 RepID=UPI002E143E97|nr:hypothetical protein OG430_33420 [Streptomyces sp. NBC_01304]